jgi:hypothetical protein
VAARGSVLEMVPLLELARRASLLPVEMHESLKGELEGLSKMLAGLIRGSDQKSGADGGGGSGKVAAWDEVRRAVTAFETLRPCPMAGP